MKKIIALMGMAALPIAGMNAQDKFGPYETNRFIDNWFIGIDGGVQTIFGGPNDHGSFGKRLAPVFDFNMGKWITPNVGVRGMLSLGQMRGYGLAGSRWTYGEADAAGYMRKKYNLFSAEATVLYNISNAWWGYRADRIYNCIPFAGFGVARSYKNDIKGTSPALFAGILNQFRLSDAWALNLELKAGMGSYYLDRAAVDNGRTSILSTGLTIGVTYKFKKRNFKRPEKPDYTPYNNKISALENDLALATAQASRMKQELDAEKARKETHETIVCNAPEQAVFFSINSAKLSKAEIVNLKLYADAINKSPNNQFMITGYADIQTGPRAFNDKLAKDRAEAVAKVLVDKYGVNASQLIVASGNLDNPPFEDTRYNRAVILEMK